MAKRTKSTAAEDASKPAGGQSGYTVLARRYRSRDFDELIGQEPIARTLLNAIKSNRTAHAYLFCGTRGVGKTSMARIFAKALNATDDLKEKDAVAEAILRGDDLDVIEIDGASNRGINEARDLIAGAGLSPARSPYKIYIIDEVHMLTREAFNALLKTMEEPPSHVKFILCTTEPHKVPATIQSRCQRFDFRPIPSAKIAEQLRRILTNEGIEAEDEVIAQVARLGNGSMRDALSLLDRLLAGGDRTLTTELLEQMLGLPDHALIVQLVDAIIASDPAETLKLGAELLTRGSTIEQALELLAEHLRLLMIIAACGESCDFLDLTEEHRKTAARQAQHFDAPALVHLIAICDATIRNARGSATARALFDAAMVRMAMSQHFADLASLLGGNGHAPAVDSKKKDRPPGEFRHTSPLGDVAQQSAPAPVSAASAPFQGRTETSPPVAAPPSRPNALLAEPKPLPPQTTAATTAAEDESPLDGPSLWEKVRQVAAGSMGDRMRTEHLVLEAFDGRTLTLSVDDSGADVVRYLQGEVDRIADLVRRATGRSLRVELDTSRFDAPASTAPALDPNEIRRSPMVAKAMELFDAVVISVEDAPPHADQQQASP